MAQFRDLVLSSESFRRDAKSINDRLDTYASERLGKYKSEQSLYRFSTTPSGSFSASEGVQLGNDTVELIHRVMWEASKPVKGHTYRRYQGNLADIVNGTFELFSTEAAFGLSKAVSIGLHKSGRVRNSGKAIRGRMDVRVRPLEESFTFVDSFSGKPWAKEPYKPTRRDEDDIARQQAKAAKMDKPVKTTVDPSIIPLPDPNPESVMEYVVKLTACNKALEDKAAQATVQISDQHQTIVHLNQQLEELKAKDEESKWGKVVDKIASMREGV